MAILRLPSQRRALVVPTLLLIAGLSACAAPAEGSDDEVIRIGVASAETREWSVFKDLAKEAGYTIEYVTYSDGDTPNEALDEGTIDLNNFQHLAYLGSYNVRFDTDLTVLGSTAFHPYGLYWKRKNKDDLDDLSQVEEIAVPFEPAEFQRAQLFLESKGLLNTKLAGKSTKNLLNAYRRGIPTVLPAHLLERLDLTPDGALASEEISRPWIYVWAVDEENEDDPRLKELVELWHHPEVEEAVIESSRSAAEPVNLPRATLLEYLSVEEEHFSQ